MAGTMTPQEVRDELVRCFVEAQYEKIHELAKRLGSAHERKDVEQMIALQVKEAFARVSADYEKPTREDFPRVMEVLVQKASAIGKPKEEIEQHRRQIEALLSRLP